jgi:hypothetical protein
MYKTCMVGKFVKDKGRGFIPLEASFLDTGEVAIFEAVGDLFELIPMRAVSVRGGVEAHPYVDRKTSDGGGFKDIRSGVFKNRRYPCRPASHSASAVPCGLQP